MGILLPITDRILSCYVGSSVSLWLPTLDYLEVGQQCQPYLLVQLLAWTIYWPNPLFFYYENSSQFLNIDIADTRLTIISPLPYVSMSHRLCVRMTLEGATLSEGLLLASVVGFSLW